MTRSPIADSVWLALLDEGLTARAAAARCGLSIAACRRAARRLKCRWHPAPPNDPTQWLGRTILDPAVRARAIAGTRNSQKLKDHAATMNLRRLNLDFLRPEELARYRVLMARKGINRAKAAQMIGREDILLSRQDRLELEARFQAALEERRRRRDMAARRDELEQDLAARMLDLARAENKVPKLPKVAEVVEGDRAVRRDAVYRLIRQQPGIDRPAIVAALGISLPMAKDALSVLKQDGRVYPGEAWKSGYFCADEIEERRSA